MGERNNMSQKLYLQHTGTPQRFNYDPKNSGRYRKGSGANPHQHGFDKIYEQDKLMREYVGVKINPDTGKPYTKTEFVKKILGMSTEEYRKGRSSMKLAREEYNLPAPLQF